jgi:hypothetical protein
MNISEKNQVLIRDNGGFPKDVLVVVANEDEVSLLTHALGGGCGDWI